MQVELPEYLLPLGPERFIFASGTHYVPSRSCIVSVTQSLTVREEQKAGGVREYGTDEEIWA